MDHPYYVILSHCILYCGTLVVVVAGTTFEGFVVSIGVPTSGAPDLDAAKSVNDTHKNKKTYSSKILIRFTVKETRATSGHGARIRPAPVWGRFS